MKLAQKTEDDLLRTTAIGDLIEIGGRPCGDGRRQDARHMPFETMIQLAPFQHKAA